jgi:uncharacterized membrane protein YjfL (UPF0719 family)
MAGWLIMILSVGAVCTLLFWCVYKIVTTPNETDHIHGFEGETPDVTDRKEP